MPKDTPRNRRALLLVAALALISAACSGSTTSTTAPEPTTPATVEAPTTVAPVATTTVAPVATTTTAPPPVTTTTTTTTSTTVPSVTTTTEIGSVDTTVTTLGGDVDASEPCAVFGLFVEAVNAPDYELAFDLVHPYAKYQPPLGLETGVDRFVDAEDPAFRAYAVEVAGPAHEACRFLEFGESFGDPIGAVELIAGGVPHTAAMRAEDGEWRIDQLTEHVVVVAPPPGSVQPSFAAVAFTTPLGTFDMRLQVDGEDVFDFRGEESLTDFELIDVTYAPSSGFGSGEHVATLMTVLENGLLDAAAVQWSVP